MFGEFTCYLFSLNSQFINNVQPVITNDNRYLFPNYLDIINLNIKNLDSKKDLLLSNSDLNTLNYHFRNKNVLIPTHWYHNVSNFSDINIRLVTSNINIIKLSYCLFWIKSHKKTLLWDEREKEICELIKNNHKNSNLLKALLNQSEYHNWKFVAIRDNLLKNNELNLNFYIEKKFLTYLISAISNKKYNNWTYYDIGKLLHGDMSNINDIELLLGIKINKHLIEEYREKNLITIKKYLNLTLEDFKKPTWIEILKEFVNS